MINYSFNLKNKLKAPLSDIEFQKYLELAQNGDYDAQVKLFEHNLRFVVYIINKYFSNSTVDKDDLFQIGSMELWKAIQRFDYSKNVKLMTYATTLIYGGIKTYINEKSNTLVIPKNDRVLLSKILDLKSVDNTLGIRELSKKLKVPEIDIIFCLKSHKDIISLSKQCLIEYETENEVNIENIISKVEPSIEDIVEHNDLCNKLEKIINELDEREKFIIEYVFRLDRSQLECAEKLNMSQSHTSKIQHRALRKICDKILEDEENIDLFELNNRKKYIVKYKNK